MKELNNTKEIYNRSKPSFSCYETRNKELNITRKIEKQIKLENKLSQHTRFLIPKPFIFQKQSLIKSSAEESFW